MKVCDTFRESKHTLTTSTYFHGVRTPQTPGSTLLGITTTVRRQFHGCSTPFDESVETNVSLFP